MVRSLPHPSAFSGIDPKRIAANSVAIAVHALALAVLMMPSTWTPAPPPPQETRVVIEEVVPPPVIPVMPPPPQPQRPQTPQTGAEPEPRVLESPPVDTPPVMDVGDVYAPPVEEGPVIDTFDPGPPALATLAYDVYPAPRYPRQDLRAGNTGTVTLRVLVDATGRPQEASIERSSGHRGLDRAARDQVLAHWRFHPAHRQGRAIAAYALVPIEFNLP